MLQISLFRDFIGFCSCLAVWAEYTGRQELVCLVVPASALCFVQLAPAHCSVLRQPTGFLLFSGEPSSPFLLAEMTWKHEFSCRKNPDHDSALSLSLPRSHCLPLKSFVDGDGTPDPARGQI